VEHSVRLDIDFLMKLIAIALLYIFNFSRGNLAIIDMFHLYIYKDMNIFW